MATVIERGKVKGKRVCGECAATGILIVNSSIAPVVETTKAERRSQQETLAPFIKLFEGQLRNRRSLRADVCADQSSYEDGRVEQLEAVIAVLKEGRA